MALIAKTPHYFHAQMHACRLMHKNLPKNLPYHRLGHTFDDVIPSFDRLADLMSINGEELLLGKTAAAYHDSGFTQKYKRNEHIGAAIAGKILPYYGFSRGQINRVGRIILSTQVHNSKGVLRQFPGNDILEQLMCDADLDSLGRKDFFKVGNRLRVELEMHGTSMRDTQWYESQLAFLEGHRYYTAAAVAMREKGKEKNIKKLKEILER